MTENRNPVTKPSTKCLNIWGGDGFPVSANDGSQYVRGKHGNLVLVNKQIMTKKQRNRLKDIRRRAGILK